MHDDSSCLLEVRIIVMHIVVLTLAFQICSFQDGKDNNRCYFGPQLWWHPKQSGCCGPFLCLNQWCKFDSTQSCTSVTIYESICNFCLIVKDIMQTGFLWEDLDPGLNWKLTMKNPKLISTIIYAWVYLAKVGLQVQSYMYCYH